MKKEKIREIFEILKQKFNYTENIELNYINPYTLLVAVVLSAQATDKGVNKATEDLFKVVQTPKEMLELGEEKLKNFIKTINYCNTKAKNIIKLSEKLVKDFGSIVPDTREKLTSLNGVGRKTANIILNTVYKIPSIAVDTHVFRVSNRIGLTKNSKNVLNSEIELEKIIPSDLIYDVNHCLVLLGRYTCKAIKPQCELCPINKLCEKNII